MNTLRQSRVARPVRTFLRPYGRHSQKLRQTSTSSSVRSIEVPTSQTTNKREYLPMTAECPAPTCDCGEMPTGLDIDNKKPLRGTMPRYSRHILIHTGQDDWESRIEEGTIGKEDRKGVNLARELKVLTGPKGKYHDVCTGQMDLYCISCLLGRK